MSKNQLHRLLIIICLTFMCASWGVVDACINFYATNIEGERILYGDLPPNVLLTQLQAHESREEWAHRRAEFERHERMISPNRMDASYAATLLHWGEIKKAISVLERAEQHYPGAYATAANLGTAYELNGENVKALEWIKESLRRNDRAHQGTEWLHVKILEAKIALEREPQWLRTNSVLGIKYDTAGKPLMPERVLADHTGQPKTAQEVEEALIYQLHERLEFVSRPDPIVADLLFELGNLLAVTRTVEHAAVIYELALSYNPQQRELLQARVERSNKLMRHATMREYARYGVPSALLLAIVCIAAYYLLRRARLRNSTSPGSLR